MSRSSNSLLSLPPETLPYLQSLGQRLRALRLMRNMTLEQAAERLLCSPTTYRSLEQGKPTVSLGLLLHALWLFGKLDDVDRVCPLEIGMLNTRRTKRQARVGLGISDDERSF